MTSKQQPLDEVDGLLELTRDLSPEEALAATVVRLALKYDGPKFLTWPCGRWWIETIGFEAVSLWPMATKGTAREGTEYRAKDRCPHMSVSVVSIIKDREAYRLHKDGRTQREIAEAQSGKATKSTLRMVWRRIKREEVRRNGHTNGKR